MKINCTPADARGKITSVRVAQSSRSSTRDDIDHYINQRRLGKSVFYRVMEKEGIEGEVGIKEKRRREAGRREKWRETGNGGVRRE